MTAVLDKDRDEKPWAVSGLLHGLDDFHDSEGRPLGERRASSAAKIDVPIVLKPCPYHDERKGAPMNVSALAQVTTYLPVVLKDLAGFRALQLNQSPSWRNMFTAIIDQLSGPARFLINGNSAEPLPPALAVGHKVAAGYFGVLRNLLADEVQGRVCEPTLDGFLGYIRESRALIGASEACAGPPVMLAKVSEALLLGDPSVTPCADSDRLTIAQYLCDQILLGLSWELFDRSIERELLVDDEYRPEMRARNAFMDGLLSERRLALRQEVQTPSVDHARACLAYLHQTSEVQPFSDALLFWVDGRVPESCARSIAMLYGHNEGAVELLDEVTKPFMARRLASYLHVYRELLAAQWRFEQRLRQLLRCESSTPVCRNSLIVPKAKALRWYEATLGHQLRAEIQEAPQLLLANHRRRMTIFDECALEKH